MTATPDAADLGSDAPAVHLSSKTSRQVRRGDSAEEMYANSLLKAVPAVDELSPLAGTVGIELVPQALVLTALTEQADAETIATDDKSAPLAGDTPQVGNADSELELADMQHRQVTADASHQQDELSEAGSISSRDDQAQQEVTHVPDNEAAVLIAQDAESSSGSPAQQKRSRQNAAALDRHRVWYKERPVQLTILG